MTPPQRVRAHQHLPLQALAFNYCMRVSVGLLHESGAWPLIQSASLCRTLLLAASTSDNWVASGPKSLEARQEGCRTLLTRAIMAKTAASGMRVVGTPSCAICSAIAWPPKVGAPSAATSCVRSINHQWSVLCRSVMRTV